MNYSECLQYLNKLGNEVLTMKFGLETIQRLLDALGNPHRDYPSVLIAGTNGKGSTAGFLSSICTASGLKTGLYTSPHLIRIEERIRVDGVEANPVEFAEAMSHVVETIQELDLPCHPTFFEVVTATAFLLFSKQRIQLAVLEVGMGGRLDSTNVVSPLFSIITPVGLDHQQYLGETLQQISAEKAGIMREGQVTLSAPQTREVWESLSNEARKVRANVEELDVSELNPIDLGHGRYRFSFRNRPYLLDVLGEFQTRNAALAIRAAQELRKHGFEILDEQITQGLKQAEIGGALRQISSDPLIIVDGGHNADAASLLSSFLQRHLPHRKALVFGAMKDKDLPGLLNRLEGLFQEVFLTQINSPRAAPVEELRNLCPRGVAIKPPFEAVKAALLSVDTVVVTGSLHLVGEVLKEFQENGLPPKVPTQL